MARSPFLTIRQLVAGLSVMALAVSCAVEEPAPDHKAQLNASYGTAAHDPRPSPLPDRIVLNFKGDPATSIAVTWRTDTTMAEPVVEIAPATASPKFFLNASKVSAKSERVETENGVALYHSAVVTGLTPATTYGYRVGGGDFWSEWLQFETASNKAEPFSFVYFGDAQNNLLSLWSRTIREAYSDAPDAAFLLHAGDLVNRPNRDIEWGEWFESGGWIHATVPGILSPGNHEYATDTEGVQSAWWEVDLGEEYLIDSIVIWNRTDCCGERLANFYVTVSGSRVAHIKNPPNPSVTIPLNNKKGRYVRIELAGKNYLSLAEVQVMGGKDEESAEATLTNVALGKIARQSSTYPGGGPQRAVDNNTSGHWDHGSVTHTNLDRRLSRLWRPHFTLPEGGIEGLEESVYYVDYQGARIISLNSNEKRDAQAPWLEHVLSDNPNRWTFITFHHPIYSTAEGRDNKGLRELWKPIFDKYRVDLVFTGHDHAYGRGRNLPTGVSATDADIGTVYVVSVSGPKQYKLTPNKWWDRAAENTQLYQVISVNGDTLEYRAMTATGELYDAFDLVKQDGRPNRMIDRAPDAPERTHGTTIGGRK